MLTKKESKDKHVLHAGHMIQAMLDVGQQILHGIASSKEEEKK